MSQKLAIIGFKCVINKSKFYGVFIRNYNEDTSVEYFLKAYVQNLKKLLELHIHLPFLPDRIKIGKLKKVATKLYDKKNMLYTKYI